MNINDYLEDLKVEEQRALNVTISKLEKALNNLNKEFRGYVEEARNTDISVNPDLYAQKLMAQKGIKNTKENLEQFYRSKDELYRARLLLQHDDGNGGYEELKVGLRSCIIGGDTVIVDWKMPVCRHYMLDNTSIKYDHEYIDKKTGEKHKFTYTLLVKNDIKLRFTRLKSVVNLFPGAFDDNLLSETLEAGFFSKVFVDKMLVNFDPDKFNPDEAAQIIADAFLTELLERRSTPEFKNIVFSIQKKQGEIIQSPYENNMIVQGCAGSGKSMIMLHRIPIILYDNPATLNRNNIYIISPSPMYIQLAEKMRDELEITDVQMGTLEQYYDQCIDRYSGHSHKDYGTIYRRKRITPEQVKYIYSPECIEDIRKYYESIVSGSELSLVKAQEFFGLKQPEYDENALFSQKIGDRLLNTRQILNANDSVLRQYFTAIMKAVASIDEFRELVTDNQNKIIRVLQNRVSEREADIEKWKLELEKYPEDSKSSAVTTRMRNIEISREDIEGLNKEIESVKADWEYFIPYVSLRDKAKTIIKPFADLNPQFSENDIKRIYDVIDRIGALIGGLHMLLWEASRIEDKYVQYQPPISKACTKLKESISVFESVNGKYLEHDYCIKISEENKTLAKINTMAVRNAYDSIMEKLGITRNENGSIRATVHSPYIFLQALYQFGGAPSLKGNSLIAIDEAQVMEPEELRLLSLVNKKVVFNLFGDVNQHIENTKGVDSWDEFSHVIEHDYHEMNENYRNAYQITEYCNKAFDMKMNPINVEGKGVHEIESEAMLLSEMPSILRKLKGRMMMAILVNDKPEAKYMLERFSDYSDYFNDMTDGKSELDSDKWNVILVNDSKGLEFNTVMVFNAHMSRNQKYIAYTRALDELYICSIQTNAQGADDEKEDETDIEDNDSPESIEALIQNEDTKKGLEKKILSSESELKSLDNRIGKLKKHLNTVQSDIDKLQKKVFGKKKATEEVQSKKDEISRINAELLKLEKKRQEVEKSINSVREELKHLNEER